jgi:hypothetical protein
MAFPLIPVLFGAAQAGLGIFQGIAGQRAAEQDYLNQTAFQKANGEFASWQANLNVRANNLNSQYGFWAETVNHNQQLAFAHSQRNVELMRAIRQAEVVAETRAAAGAGYIQDSQAISAAFGEASMQEAVAMQQFQWRSLQARASVQAMAMEGNSVDRLVNDYARQEGEYMALQQINQGIRGRQYTREQAGQVAQYLSRWNNQQFYEEQDVFDPIPPFAPLPTMVTPAGPTMTGAAPSGAAGALGIGSAILGGVNAGIGMHQSLNRMKLPTPTPGGNG